jgi:hypothetical protein
MAERIVGFQVTVQHGDPYGLRIDADGQAEDYRVSKMVKGADGTYKDQPVTPGWYPVIKLSEAQVKAVKQAVDASGLRKMPAKISGDTQTTSASSDAQWWVGDKTIKVAPWPPGGEYGQALFQLSSTLSEIVNKALASR